jgi:hypothetical protein
MNARFRGAWAGTKNLASSAYLRAGVLVGGAMLATAAHAQATDPISTLLDSIDLSGVAAKVAAVALLIVGIALTFKGPDLSKRVIKKV